MLTSNRCFEAPVPTFHRSVQSRVMRFALIELCAFSVWGTGLAAAGYFLSHSAEAIIGHVKSIERFLLGALIVAVLLYLGGRLFTRHEIKKHLRPPPTGE